MYKVSILIPMGSDRPFLFSAIKSALQQDFDKNKYEIIFINDGCKKITKRKIMSLLAKASGSEKYNNRPRVIYHENQKNLGLSHSLNIGAKLATGEYITILPDDDMFFKNKLKVLSAFLDKNSDIGAVYSLAKTIDAKEKVSNASARLTKFLNKYPRVSWEDIENGSGFMVSGATCMYRRKIYLDIGGFDKELRRAEEWEFHLRIMKEGHIFAGLPVYTTYYRVHSLNKSKQNRRSVQRKKQMNYIYKKLRIGRGKK